MKIRHFLLLLVVLASLCTVGCAPARSGQAYLTEGGRGEVRGRMSGAEFSAVVEISAGGETARIEYLAPASLCGLSLTVEKGECEVTLGEVSFTCSAEEVAGFLRPVNAFLPQGEAVSVQKAGENTVLTFPDGGTLTLSPDGTPISFAREDIEMHTLWWETGSAE